MIVLSDNWATNLLIRTIGMTYINETAKLYGLKNTELKRYMMDTAAQARGEENTTTALDVGAGRGVAILAAQRVGIPLYEYTPMQIKQAVVGTGAADKRQVAYMVRTLTQLDHDPHPDHAADALACAICHVNLSRTRALTGGEFYQQRGTGY